MDDSDADLISNVTSIIRPTSEFYRKVAARHLGEAPSGVHVDHINTNPLDNRSTNLRYVSPAINAKNRVKRPRFGGSTYRGVYQQGTGWAANINRKHIGIFDSERDAAYAADFIMRNSGYEVKQLNYPRIYKTEAQLKNLSRSSQRKNKGYLGVVVDNRQQKPYNAIIRIEKRKIRLGMFATIEEAAKTYDKKAYELRGSKARLNFPEDYDL